MFKDIIKIASDEIGYTGNAKNIEPPEFHKIVQVKDMIMSSNKLKDLGFKEEISLEEGVKDLCKKY